MGPRPRPRPPPPGTAGGCWPAGVDASDARCFASGSTTTAKITAHAIAAVSGAVASSLRNRTVKAGTAVFGEVGLAGEVRGVSQAALRVREAAQMGFTRCVIPEGNCSPDDVPAGIELVGVRTVSEALEQLIEW